MFLETQTTQVGITLTVRNAKKDPKLNGVIFGHIIRDYSNPNHAVWRIRATYQGKSNIGFHCLEAAEYHALALAMEWEHLISELPD